MMNVVPVALRSPSENDTCVPSTEMTLNKLGGTERRRMRSGPVMELGRRNADPSYTETSIEQLAPRG